MKSLLLDKIYIRFDKDPTNTIAQKCKILIEKSNFPSKIKLTLKPTNLLRSRLYGLPKIYKPDNPLRPIVSATNFPTYDLSRFLAKELKPLIRQSGIHIINSTDFTQKIQKIRLHSADILVSFDVESLFTQIPIKDTLDIIKSSHEVPSSLIPLIEHYLTITSLTMFYRLLGQLWDLPFLLIANIFMEL